MESFMKPYGWHHLLWKDEDYGPSSKHCKLKSRKRHEWRRLLHKKGRSQQRKELEEQIQDK